MFKIKNHSPLIFIFLVEIIFFQIKIRSEIIGCPKSNPIYIKSSDSCELKYCEVDDFSSGKCTIANDTVKTQWLNNIITICSLNFRYINFAKYENGDMVIGITEYPESIDREFYGIKYNGRPYFTKDSKETSYYKIEIPDNVYGLFEGEGKIVKTKTDGKEYYFYLSKLENYAEMYDLENSDKYSTLCGTFGNVDSINSLRHAILPLNDQNNNNFYIISFMASNHMENESQYYYFKKYSFDIKLNPFYQCIKTVRKENALGLMISCFKTSNSLIICFYKTSVQQLPNYITTIYLNLIKYSSELTEEKVEPFEVTNRDPSTFYKCVHLVDKVGVFAYFDNYSNSVRVHLLFKEFDNNRFKNYLPNSDLVSDSKIILKPTDIASNLLLNDIVKISDNNVCLTATSSDKETIYIITVKIFGEKQIKIRYYYIPSFKLYNYKILFEQRIDTYKNFIAFSSSFCPNEVCSSDDDEHYANLILFSYPSGRDYTLFIEKYLLDNNNILISNFKFDLHDHTVIENNIFGYIYNAILIQKVEGYENLTLFSSINPNEEITNNKSIAKNEKIIINLTNTDNNYGLVNCKLEYIYKVNNPPLNIYDTYPDDIEGDNDSESYTIEEYIGRLTYYNIVLNNELTAICDDPHCLLCLKQHKDFCITCRYDYNITKDNNDQYYKICLPVEFTEITTEMQTDIITTYNTDIITTQITAKNTEKLTEITADKITDGNECSVDQILDNECTEGIMGLDQLGSVYDYMKSNYINSNITDNQIIIQTKNVLFQLSSNEDQKNNNNPSISSIDLLECEEKLKAAYNIDEDEDLIILKTDIKSSDLTQTYVQYEIYHPIDLTPLELSVCDDVTVSINAPVKLDDSISSLYINLKNSGYNLFQNNDPFYTDICTVYTSENGTDMLLEDRIKEIFKKSGNKPLCQSGCELLNYDSIQGKAECKCSTQKNRTDTFSVNSDNQFMMMDMVSESFSKTLKNSNFKVLKCYKIAFDMKTIAKNIGKIFMSIIIILNLILTIIFCFVDFKNINKYLVIILNRKMIYIKNFSGKAIKRSKIQKRKAKKMKSSLFKKNKILEDSNNNVPPKKKAFISRNSNKKNIFDNISKVNDGNISVKSLLGDDSLRINRKLASSKKEVNINIIPINHFNVANNNNQNNVSNNNNQINVSNNNKDSNEEKNNENQIEIKNQVNEDNIEQKKIENENKNIAKVYSTRKKKITNANNIEKNNNISIVEKNNNIYQMNAVGKDEKQNIISIQKKNKKLYKRKCNSMNILPSFPKKDKKSNNKKRKNSDLSTSDLTEHELNNLEYELAIEVDKRGYFQYYWSLLKRKQLILFSFYPINDYNLYTIKICLFLISFSLYITINGFFFSDKTMHNIHENNGKYKILVQLPQIFYSCFVSAVINIILKQLSLSERSLIEIKKEDNKKILESKTKEVVSFLKMKFLIFYIIDYLLLFFYWYFLSCFCGVYINTQTILFEDSLISFGISMLYPFGINLLPGMFRIQALRAKKKDQKTLYKASNLLALI